MVHRFLLVLGLSGLASATAGAAYAQEASPRAEYKTAADLGDDGFPHLLEIAMAGEYSRVVGDETAGDLLNVGAFDLRLRAYLGETLAYCAGFDGRIGASDTGVVYEALAHVVGAGLRFEPGHVIGLCTGIGVNGIDDGIEAAPFIPVELTTSITLGPLRPTLWLRPAWVLDTPSREEGAELDFIDELETGVTVRLGEQRPYWADMSAGGGLALGFVYRHWVGTHMIGGTLGLDFAGGQ